MSEGSGSVTQGLNFYHSISALLLLGLSFRLALFNAVTVNYDAGFYLYDASQILWGQVPIVDYPTRSPLFHYLLAGVLSLQKSPITTARVLMAVVSLATGVAVAVLTRELHSTRAGVVALAIYLFTPFSLIWGLWLKTEQFAQFVVILGLVPWVKHLDDETLKYRYSAIVGMSLATGFLIRRVVVAHGLAIVVFFLYYKGRTVSKPPLVKHVAMIGSASLLTLAVTYAFMAGFNPVTMKSIIYQHVFTLFFGNGAGGLSWIEFGPQQVVSGDQAQRRIRIITLTTTVHALTTMLPAYLLLFLYPVSKIREPKHDSFSVLLLIFFLFLGGGGLGLFALTQQMTYLIIAITSFGAIGYFFALSRVPSFSEIWNPKLWLPLYIIVITFLGYILRDRMLFLTYFQDIFPYISILTGVSGASLVSYDAHLSRLSVPPIAVAFFTIILALGFATPFTLAVTSAQPNSEVTISEVHQIGTDLAERMGPEDRVFTAQPLYILEAGRHVSGGFAREYWIIRYTPDSKIAQEVGRATAEAIRNSNTQYVVVEPRAKNLIQRNANIKHSIKERFCPIQDQQPYSRVGAVLYRRSDSAPRC